MNYITVNKKISKFPFLMQKLEDQVSDLTRPSGPNSNLKRFLINTDQSASFHFLVKLNRTLIMFLN